MGQKGITLREALAAVLSGCAVLVVMAWAQIMDSADMERDQAHVRAEAVSVGFEEGLNRIRCRGGVRYDAATGFAVDVMAHKEVSQ